MGGIFGFYALIPLFLFNLYYYSMKRIVLFTMAVVGLIANGWAQRTSQGLSGVLVPRYMSSGTSSTRIPVYARIRVGFLMPNSSYKYTVQTITNAELNTTNLHPGKGGSIYIDNSNNYTYSTSADFSTSSGYGTLTSNMMGEYEGWFGVVGAGDHSNGDVVYLAISMIGSSNDTVLYYCADSMTVVDIGTSSNQASAIYGKCVADTMGFVAMYDSYQSIGRPLYVTSVEGNKYAGSSLSNLASFYNNSVFKKNSVWGAVIPNSLDSGVRAITHFASAGTVTYTNRDPDGQWGVGNIKTAKLSSGGSAVVLTEDEAPLVEPVVDFWRATSNSREGVTKHQLLVTRKYSNSADQSIRVTVSGGTAGKNSDYIVADSQIIVFKPGKVFSDTVNITVVDDQLAEPTEDYVFRLGSPSNCKIGRENFHTVNLIDNDVANISFKSKEIKVDEGSGSVKIQVNTDLAMSAATKLRMLIKKTGDSTYVPAEFYLSHNTYKDTVFDIGKSNGKDSVVITAKLFEDVQADPNDTIDLVIRRVSGFGVLKDTTLRIVLIDNDGPTTIKMLTNKMTIKESDGSVDVKVVITNRKAAGGDFALRLVTAESSAKESLDLKFNPTSQLRSISSSTPDTMVFTIPVIDDLDYEGTESMKFGLINVSNTIIAKPDTTRIMILDNDLPIYTIGKINKQTKADGTMDSSGVACRVRGVVYGVNTRSSGLGFTLRDQTGGINVYSPVKNFGYVVSEGDSILVQGKVSQFQGTGQLDFVDTIIWYSSGNKIKTPTVVTDINEKSEADLVQMRRVILVDAAEWPTSALNANGFAYVRVSTTDGLIDTLNIDAETNIDGTSAPVGYFNVTGIGIQYDNKAPYKEKHYLAPRSVSDFSAASLPVVRFLKTADQVTELADSFLMEMSILPTDENFSFDVVCIGGTAVSPQDYDFVTRTINVKKNNNYYALKANISDDTEADGDKTLVFAIRNAKGPGAIGRDSVITLTIKDNEASSVRTFGQGSISMYPNPSKGQFVVRDLNGQIAKVQILDLNGKLVYETSEANGVSNTMTLEKSFQFDLTGMSGVYIISAETQNGSVYTERLVVQ